MTADPLSWTPCEGSGEPMSFGGRLCAVCGLPLRGRPEAAPGHVRLDVEAYLARLDAAAASHPTDERA